MTPAFKTLTGAYAEAATANITWTRPHAPDGALEKCVAFRITPVAEKLLESLQLTSLERVMSKWKYGCLSNAGRVVLVKGLIHSWVFCIIEAIPGDALKPLNMKVTTTSATTIAVTIPGLDLTVGPGVNVTKLSATKEGKQYLEEIRADKANMNHVEATLTDLSAEASERIWFPESVTVDKVFALARKLSLKTNLYLAASGVLFLPNTAAEAIKEAKALAGVKERVNRTEKVTATSRVALTTLQIEAVTTYLTKAAPSLTIAFSNATTITGYCTYDDGRKIDQMEINGAIEVVVVPAPPRAGIVHSAGKE
jgi:hypothetical protein